MKLKFSWTILICYIKYQKSVFKNWEIALILHAYINWYSSFKSLVFIRHLVRILVWISMSIIVCMHNLWLVLIIAVIALALHLVAHLITLFMNSFDNACMIRGIFNYILGYYWYLRCISIWVIPLRWRMRVVVNYVSSFYSLKFSILLNMTKLWRWLNLLWSKGHASWLLWGQRKLWPNDVLRLSSWGRDHIWVYTWAIRSHIWLLLWLRFNMNVLQLRRLVLLRISIAILRIITILRRVLQLIALTGSLFIFWKFHGLEDLRVYFLADLKPLGVWLMHLFLNALICCHYYQILARWLSLYRHPLHAILCGHTSLIFQILRLPVLWWWHQIALCLLVLILEVWAQITCLHFWDFQPLMNELIEFIDRNVFELSICTLTNKPTEDFLEGIMFALLISKVECIAWLLVEGGQGVGRVDERVL